MSVIVGSARIDENGHAHGGKAGDQTGKELSTQNWYKHKKGWRVLRCIDPEKALRISAAMRSACANNKIGYDQYQRLTLYNAAKNVGFDPGKVTTACETDCSALVRVCLAYAGISCGNFRTPTQARMMLDTGMFVELTGSKYTDQSDYLRRGDVLVTRTQGHTVVVLSDGPRAAQDESIAAPDYALGDRILKNGMSGADVKELQTNLISLGYSCGAWGADGDFGDATEMAVREFQRKNGCDVDGDVGPETLSALDSAMSKSPSEDNARYIYVSGGNCWIRAAPIIGGKKLGVAHNGDKIKYGGQTTDTGWLLVEYDGQNAWISGKYGRIADE